MTEKQTLELGYWAIRGLGQPIRNLLTYLGIKFEDKRFGNPEEWQKVKSTLNTDFPNLPYLRCGEKVTTESEAIFLGICLQNKREDLIGSTIEERVIINQLMGVIRDVNTSESRVLMAPDQTEEKAISQFESSVLPLLQKLAKRLGTNKFLTGKLSMADFFLYVLIDFLNALDSKSYLGKVPIFFSYMENFRNIPELKNYLASDLMKNTLFIPPFAQLPWIKMKG